MKPPRRLPARVVINVIGLASIVLIMLVGVMTFAAPQIAEAVSSQRSQKSTEQANSLLLIQLAGLQAAQGEITHIEQELAKLRQQIPASEKLDEVFYEVIKAAEATGAQLLEIRAGTPAPWVERTSDEATALVNRDQSGSETPAAGDTAPAAGGPLSVSITVTVNMRDLSSATRFLDALTNTTRLLGIRSIDINQQSDDLKLFNVSLSLDTFVMPEER